ncbi:MAG: hypothetical protein IIA41_00585 [SAR324 cluster bacterium]|nr:hypothetical protein [SAR324 cluster bacterium]
MDKSHAGIPGPSGAVKSELTHLTGRMTRRQTALTVLRGLALWAALFASGTLLALAADALWNLGTALLPLLAGLGVMTLVAAAAVVRRFRRGPARLLLLADREIGGEEQLTTAYELLADRPQHPLLPALLQRCKPLVARVDPRRVLPFALGGPEWAAGGSILVALAVFFAAAYWPEGPPSAGRRMREAVRQEGRRIQQMADRLEAAAERDSFFQVSQLTPRLRAAAMAFQRDEVEPAGAVQRLFDLSGEAARLAEAAMPIEEFLAAEAESGNLNLKLHNTGAAKALLHGHCHQKAMSVLSPVQDLLERIPGLEVETVETSCCGMAGAFGYQAETVEVSRAMGELDLLPAVRAAERETLVVADGTSCRHQIADGAGREALHAARVLLMAVEAGREAVK